VASADAIFDGLDVRNVYVNLFQEEEAGLAMPGGTGRRGVSDQAGIGDGFETVVAPNVSVNLVLQVEDNPNTLDAPDAPEPSDTLVSPGLSERVSNDFSAPLLISLAVALLLLGLVTPTLITTQRANRRRLLVTRD
jgi:hypothetical protein